MDILRKFTSFERAADFADEYVASYGGAEIPGRVRVVEDFAADALAERFGSAELDRFFVVLGDIDEAWLGDEPRYEVQYDAN